jgi:aminopeptidase N
LGESATKQVNLIRFNYNDKEDMFDGHSYNKGGQILHMLRKYVGDDAFFASLKLYLETNKFKSVEIHNLRLAFEEVTGEDLNWFFNQWFLSSGHPELDITYEYDAVNKKQKVRIVQNQKLDKTPLFKIPMYVDLYANGNKKREKIIITKADETFEFDAATKPNLVNVDAEKMLLCVKNEKKSVQEWAFQYKNAPLYLDRFEALSELVKTANDSISTYTIIAALNDKFWSLRQDAITVLKEVQPGHEAELKPKLIALAKTDEKASVRTAALNYLAVGYEGEDMMQVYKNALNDKSYAVMGAALAAISKANAQEGVKLAKQYENEKSVDILYTITDLYSNYGNDSNNDFFISVEDKFTGYNKIGYISQYLTFLKKDKKDETINAGVEIFERIAKNETYSKWVTYYAKKSIKEIATMYNEKTILLEEKLKIQKAANPNGGGIQELEAQIASAKAQTEKINAIFNSLK